MEKSFVEFESELRAQGFATVLTKEWAPHTVVDRDGEDLTRALPSCRSIRIP
jgi:hypothetical protein